VKINIYNWAFEKSVFDKLSEIGYGFDENSPQSIVEGDIFEIAKKIYDSGLNVMIHHGSSMPVIYVDTKRFGQR